MRGACAPTILASSMRLNFPKRQISGACLTNRVRGKTLATMCGDISRQTRIVPCSPGESHCRQVSVNINGRVAARNERPYLMRRNALGQIMLGNAMIEELTPYKLAYEVRFKLPRQRTWRHEYLAC